MPRFRMRPLRANNVLELFQQRDLIDLDPPYQRLSVWGKDQQQWFIDSIINGIDIPKLYFHDLTQFPQDESKFKYSVIDGKQRILSLWAFIANKLPLSTNFVYFENETYHAAGLTYDELLMKFPVMRSRFDGFEVPVVLVEVEDAAFIEQLFARLNIQVSLSAPERRNALGGPVPFLIRKIGLTPFFREGVNIRNNRLQHYDLAAKFLHITFANDFVPTKKANLDNFVKTIKATREYAATTIDQALDDLEGRTREALDHMYDFFGKNSSLLASAGRAVLYFQVFRLCENSVPFTLQMLERFNQDVANARRKSQRMSRGSGEVFEEFEDDLVRFDQEKQSTNDRNALERQYEYFRQYMSRTFQVDLPAIS